VRVGEAAGVNPATGSFRLSLAWRSRARSCWPRPAEQQRVADALEDDAQLMSNAQLEEELAGQPPEVREEIVSINTDARPLALQIALLVPLLAALLGLLISFRMVRLPQPTPALLREEAPAV